MLRYITARIRNQDWMAVAIELVVVVVGVFIGVQASNWNEQFETDRKAEAFTARLKADLRLESWNYENLFTYEEQVRASAITTLDALTGKRPMSDEALLVAAYRASQYGGVVRQRATYDELRSTGEIGLIRDLALRGLATRVYTATYIAGVTEDGKASAYRHAFRMLVPYPLQEQLAQRCGDRVVAVGDFEGLRRVLVYPCSTGLAADEIARGARLLRGDAELMPLLRLRIAEADTNIANFGGQNQDIRDGLREVARERP